MKDVKKPVVTAESPIVQASTKEWERIQAKINKKLANWKSLPTKKGDVKAYVQSIVKEAVN